MNEIKVILKDRIDAIEKRILLVLEQLDDQQVNWRPNESSNSISNLIIHINGNMKERIGSGMNHVPFVRNRDDEFEEQFKTQAELIEITKSLFSELRETLVAMSDERFAQTQKIGDRELTNLAIFIQCATHFSEHMGQILYIAKIIKDGEYVTTSVPKKKPM
ncbi:DUF1572 family protein [Paenibacillus aestuarii]|uniref:DUF1572 family protein n=1 Tax=Paenibacillus aestuarii TaxID=516965 RepID=A0ABW0K7A3_9BACL|nr:DUF1572 family protein [Paenibacillus aestuarii]